MFSLNNDRLSNSSQGNLLEFAAQYLTVLEKLLISVTVRTPSFRRSNAPWVIELKIQLIKLGKAALEARLAGFSIPAYQVEYFGRMEVCVDDRSYRSQRNGDGDLCFLPWHW